MVWPLRNGRPIVQVNLRTPDGQAFSRSLLADTGAGTANSPFDLVIDEEDCLLCGTRPTGQTSLRGAMQGTFSVYLVRVRIDALAIDALFAAVGVQSLPPGLDGTACFRFLNRFAYGNFGGWETFGLKTP